MQSETQGVNVPFWRSTAYGSQSRRQMYGNVHGLGHELDEPYSLRAYGRKRNQKNRFKHVSHARDCTQSYEFPSHLGGY